MPIVRTCKYSGCQATATTGSYCHAHTKESGQSRRLYDIYVRPSDPSLAWAKSVRDSSRWQAVRRAHRSAHPTCADPFRLHGSFAPLGTVVNHITPLRVCYSTNRHHLAYDMDNLATLCPSCDARIGAMERRGIDTTDLFNAAKSAPNYNDNNK